MLDIRKPADKRIFFMFVAVFIIVFIFSSLSPLVADDYTYSYNWATGKRNSSIADIVESMVIHWRGWHSRVLANGLASFCLMYPKVVFNVLNALNTTVIIFIFYYIFSLYIEDKKKLFIPSIFSIMMIWNFTPAFGQIFLWIDGACNYSWGVTFLLFFLIPYFQAYFGKEKEPNIIISVLLAVEAFLAGSYYESGAISAIFIALCIILILYITKRRPAAHLHINLLSAIIGFIVMMSAPSMRRGHRGSFSLDAIFELFKKFLSIVSCIISRLGTGLVIMIAFMCIALLVFLVLIRKRRKLLFGTLYAILFAGFVVLYLIGTYSDFSKSTSFLSVLQIFVTSPFGNLMMVSLVFLLLLLTALYIKADLKLILLSAILFVAGVGSVAAFIFASYFPSRGCIYYIIYLTLASGFLLHAVLSTNKRFGKAVVYVVAAIFVLSFCLGTLDIVDIHMQDEIRINTIMEAKDKGIEEIELSAFSYSTKYSAPYGLEDIRTDPTSWINSELCRYYGGIKWIYVYD